MRMNAWQSAAGFAARAHAGQIRKDGKTPYVAHVFRVAMTVRHVFGCEDQTALIAALLHDTIEDTPTDYDDIASEFGSEVADCVAALTKNMLLPEAEREKDYDARLAAADWRARLVKLADVYDNSCDTVDTRKQTARKLAERRRRAIELARVDADRPEIKRAIAAVRAMKC